MPVAFVTACADSFVEDASSLTSAAFTPSGSDRCVFSFLGTADFGGYAAPTAFNHGGSGGSAMTEVITDSSQFGVFANLYRYINPGASSATTYIAWADERLRAIVGSLVYSGVDQTTPMENEDSNIGDFDTTTGNATLTITCDPGDTVVGGLFCLDFNGGAPTFTHAHTTRYVVEDPDTNLSGGIVVEQVAAGSGVTLSVDIEVPSANFVTWVFVGGVIRAAAGGIEAVGADTVTFSDSAVSITERPAAASDTLTMSDSAVSVTERLSAASDTVAFTDSAVGIVSLPVAASDTIAFSDAAAAVVSLPAVASDTVAFTDSAEASLGVAAEAEDTVEFTDEATCVVGVQVVVEADDAVSFSDSAVATVVPPPPPPPPAPPSSLPLPAKLLGYAPRKKKRERPNVEFKPPQELERREEPAALVLAEPTPAPTIEPAPPPQTVEAVAPAEAAPATEPPPAVPVIDLAAVRDAALALATPQAEAPTAAEEPQEEAAEPAAEPPTEPAVEAPPAPRDLAREIDELRAGLAWAMRRIASIAAEQQQVERALEAMNTANRTGSLLARAQAGKDLQTAMAEWRASAAEIKRMAAAALAAAVADDD